MQSQQRTPQPAQPAQPTQEAQAAQELARQAAEMAEAVRVQMGRDGRIVVGPGGFGGRGSATAVYEAMREQRNELENQLERLEDQREEISDQLRTPTVGGADQRGLESRLATIDGRIASVEQQLAEADAAVARAAAIPGAVQPPPPPPRRQGPPEEVFVLAGIFMFVVILPLVIAYARRIWRRGAAAVTSIPHDIYERFSRLDQAIDSVAIEVERIGEGQRFLTRLHAERGLGAGAAERIEVPEREPQRQKLK
jgi:hypothetical protein